MARGPKPKAKRSGDGSGGARPKPAIGSHNQPFKIAKVAAPTLNRKQGKVQRWETEDDIPEDEEDTFHRQRDAILLDDRARRRDEAMLDEDGGCRVRLQVKTCWLTQFACR